MSKPYFVVVEPHAVPRVVSHPRFNQRELFQLLRGLIDRSPLERGPYPRNSPGCKRGLVLWFWEYGLLAPEPYNRWGIVGTFAVGRISLINEARLALAEKDLAQIRIDLEGPGYIDPASEVCNIFQGHREPGAGYVPAIGRWISG